MKSPFLLPKKRELFKLGLLALLLGATGFTLFKVWTGEGISQPQKPVSLPQRLALQDWNFISSQMLPVPNNEAVGRLTSVLGGGRLYQYQQQQLLLTVELWQVKNTNGDVPAYIDAYAQQRIATGRQQAEVRYRTGMGYYGIIQAADRTVLSSCINATGEATFSISQFSQARFQRDLSLARIAEWIVGQDTLLRKQCLWSHLSIANTNKNLRFDSILEKTWFNLQEGANSILLRFR
jgi:cyanosortase A-associated protein